MFENFNKEMVTHFISATHNTELAKNSSKERYAFAIASMVAEAKDEMLKIATISDEEEREYRMLAFMQKWIVTEPKPEGV